MGDIIEITADREEPYNIFKADSGAITFKVNPAGGYAVILLIGKEYPRKPIIKITLGNASSIDILIGVRRKARCHTYELFNSNHDDPYVNLWLTWYSGWVRFGQVGESQPVLTCRFEGLIGQCTAIGYIQLTKTQASPVSWILDGMTAPERPLAKKKQITTGKLRWAPITDPLPKDALIGGMEIKPTYIARAHHNGSLVPGKFVPWLNLCFIPWGRREHTKQIHGCEILCGYDVEWVWTYGDQIPEHAVVGGYSEVRNEPLYVGRGPCGGQLCPGKVHVMYKTCYVPYMSREHELTRYQILVSKHEEPRALMEYKGDW